MRVLRAAAALAAGLATTAQAVSLDLTSQDSIKKAASTIATKMVAFYPGDKPGGTPGLLGDPYYWWEAGGMFGSLIDYWYYTGDDQFNNITSQALVFQVSPTYDYMPPNQTKSEGNDDQVFWGFAVMTAAELKFPNPPEGTPSWISIAAAVFNSQAARWDYATCAGGLRWQIFTFNNGYTYKNSPSNAGFFNMAARLYAYTGNQTYAEWASRSWDWMDRVGLIGSDYKVYDGTDATQNCTSINHLEWTYSVGMLLNGCAAMAATITNVSSATASDSAAAANGTDFDANDWEQRATSLWKSAAGVFFPNNDIMEEVTCEPSNNCDTDQLSFKAYFSRFLVASIKWLPSLSEQIMPYIQKSAVAAAAQCSGGDDQITCGSKWYNGSTWDGTYGVGQQMSALQVIQANLINDVSGPVTNTTGGISHGNLTLGSGGTPDPIRLAPITAADRAGASILTILVVVGGLAGGWWLVSAD